MDCSMPHFPLHHHLPEFAQTHVHWVSDTIHLMLCHPLLFLPSSFSSIRVFSKELALCIRWPKYWSFSISPSNEYSGLIYFRIDWFDLAVQGIWNLPSLTSNWGASHPHSEQSPPGDANTFLLVTVAHWGQALYFIIFVFLCFPF